MMPSFLPALADASNYPRPRVPMTPYLSHAALARRSLAQQRFGLGTRPCAVTVSGRAALGRLAAHLKLTPRDRVLLPAYHCPSMVEPFMHAGCELEFYPLNADLSPHREDFKRALCLPTRLVVFVNFFGLEPPAEDCIAQARAAGVTIVHDCAHAYYALPGIPPDDYAIASLVKFFALEEGGLLLAPTGAPLDAPRGKAGLRRNLGLLSRALARRRAACASLDARPAARAAVAGRVAATATPAPAFRYFEPRDMARGPGLYTRLLFNVLGAEHAAAQRRRNYVELAEVVDGLRGVHLLYPALPAGAVPYVLPFLLDDAPVQFDAIRGAGVPLYRWEELIPTACPVSADYRTRLVQLPCHQDLSARHRDELRAALTRSLGQA